MAKIAHADRIGRQSHGDDFCGEKQRTGYVDDRVDGEEDSQQRDDETASGSESQPRARSGAYRRCAHDRDGKHHGIDDSIKNVGGIVHELEMLPAFPRRFGWRWQSPA